MSSVTPAPGSHAQAISNLLVRLLSEYTGRGPTMARTYIHEDLVTVVLRDTLTTGERSLARDGEEGLVLRGRRAYQDTMRENLVAGVEAITGRTVFAFLSANHLDPDIAVETFVLVPTEDRARRSSANGAAASGPRPGVPANGAAPNGSVPNGSIPSDSAPSD
jgi:uncharacterized protein YbcI